MATANEMDVPSPATLAPERTDPREGGFEAAGKRGSPVTSAFTTGAAAEAGNVDGIAQARVDDRGAGSARAAGDAMKERASDIWNEAKEAARTKLSEQKDVAADGLGDVAGALRDAARRQRDDSAHRPMANITGSAADALERISGTLRTKDVGSMARDVSDFARNQPLAFFGLALAGGFLAARFLKASND